MPSERQKEQTRKTPLMKSMTFQHSIQNRMQKVLAVTETGTIGPLKTTGETQTTNEKESLELLSRM